MRTLMTALTTSGLIVGAALAAGAVGPVLPVAAQEETATHTEPTEGFAPTDARPQVCRDGQHGDARAVLGVVGRSLESLVDEGTISSGQRDAIRDEIEETLRTAVGERCRAEIADRVAGAVLERIRGAGPTIAADAIGIPRDELLAAIRSGATVAEVAEENDVDRATVTDALVARGNDALDAAVTGGRIPAELAERIAERLPQIADRIVDHRGGGPRPSDGI